MDWLHIWHSLLQAVAHYPLATYLAIFLISLAESLALIGLLIPGTVMMIGIGALAGSGVISLKITLLAAMAGAVCGDGLSYWLGRHYHQRIKDLWPFRKYPQLINRGEEFFHWHGGKSVLLGRFIGPIRPVIPLIAGMLDMPARRFVLVNILSAIGWAFAYILPGVVLGSSLALIGAVSARLSLLLLLIGLLIWLTFWLCRKACVLLGRLGPRGERLLLPLLCLSLFLSSWLFLGVLEDLLTLDPLVKADHAVYQFLQSLRTPWGDHLLVAVTELGDALVNGAFAAAVLLLLVVQRKLRAAGFWLLALGGGVGLVQLFKWALHRPRPIAIYQGVSSWGFPSGHTTLSVVLFGFLAVLLVRSFSKRWNWLPFGAALGISLLVAFSRLYLGAHWLSDILGGLALGWAWVTFLGIFYLRGAPEVISKKILLPVVLATLVLAGGWHIHARHAQDLVRYQVQHQTQTLTRAAWLQGDWQRLPGWRIDLAGEVEQPLTFQWAGGPAQLASLLAHGGWKPAADFSFRSWLNLFVPQLSVEQLPLFPLFANGEQERLLLVLNQGEQRLVLRLWPSDYRLPETPLWVGTAETEGAVSLKGLLSLPRGQGDFAAALTLLQQALPAATLIQSNYRQEQGSSRYPNWNGLTLLLAE